MAGSDVGGARRSEMQTGKCAKKLPLPQCLQQWGALCRAPAPRTSRQGGWHLCPETYFQRSMQRSHLKPAGSLKRSTYTGVPSKRKQGFQ